MQRILTSLDRCLYWLVAFLLAILAVVGFTTVVFRYLLHSSLFWGDEFLRYLQIWLVFLGTALATRHRALITVDIFTQPLPHRIQEYAAAVVSGVSSIFLLALVYFSLGLVRRSVGVVSASIGIPMERMYLVFPVGLGLMAINTLRDAALHLAAASADPPAQPRTGAELPDRLVHPE
ncbi:MAG TPA: TRAP transporter small permease [Candidatus Methylomirabilis sp.]|nr:TRAP transporter small permease [Candidatus Methylomirabilis sp.]